MRNRGPLLVEVAWPIVGGRLPGHECGYALFGSLVHRGLIFHGQPDTIVLPPRNHVVIRCPEERAWRLAGAGVDSLAVAETFIRLGAPEVRPLVSSRRLHSPLVTIKDRTTDNPSDGSMRAAVRRQLDLIGVGQGCRVTIGRRRVVRVKRIAIVGYEATLSGLSPQESLAVQSRAIGGRNRMGCGGFVPC